MARFPQLDALRGLAAFWVVLFHARAGGHLPLLQSAWPGWLDTLIERGDLGVSVFFVLSGFVMAHATPSRGLDWPAVRRLFARRFVRLAPPYYASIVLVLVLGLVSTYAVAGKRFELPSLASLLAHLCFAQDLLGFAPLSSVYWTLGVELQLYCSWFMLMWCVSALRARLDEPRALLCALVPSVAFVDLWALGHAPFRLDGTAFAQAPLFFMGALLRRADALPRAAYVQALLLSLAAFARRDASLAVGVATAGVIWASLRWGALQRAFDARPLPWLGLISYSLYLTHNPICGAVFRVGKRLSAQTSLAFEACFLALALAASLLVAALSYRAIERPSIAWSRRRATRPAPPRAA